MGTATAENDDVNLSNAPSGSMVNGFAALGPNKVSVADSRGATNPNGVVSGARYDAELGAMSEPRASDISVIGGGLSALGGLVGRAATAGAENVGTGYTAGREGANYGNEGQHTPYTFDASRPRVQTPVDNGGSAEGNSTPAGGGASAKPSAPTTSANVGVGPGKNMPDPMKGPVSAAVNNVPSMTTEQANAVYGAQRQAAEAQAQQQAAYGQAVGGAQATTAAKSWEAQQANQRALAAENSAGNRSGNPRLAREARARADAIQGGADAAQENLGNVSAGKGTINPVQDFLARQKGTAIGAAIPGAAVLQGQEALEKGAYAGHLNAGSGLLGAQTVAEQTRNEVAQSLARLSKTALGDDDEAKKARQTLSEYHLSQSGQGEMTPAAIAHALADVDKARAASYQPPMNDEQAAMFTNHLKGNMGAGAASGMVKGQTGTVKGPDGKDMRVTWDGAKWVPV